CAGLYLVTVVTLPGTLDDYAAKMPGNLHQFQVVQPYLWDRHVTLRAFWRLLIQGREPGEIGALAKTCWFLSASAVGAVLIRTWWKSARASDGRAGLMAAVIAAMPLLMPFYFDYDLLLVSVAAVLYVAERGRTGKMPIDRWLTRAWVGLYLWLIVNSSVARLTHVNGMVLLLSCVALLLARRAAMIAAVSRTIETDGEISTPPLATAA